MDDITRAIKNYPERIILVICLLVALVVLYKVLNPAEESIIGEIKKKQQELEKLITTKDPLPVADVKYLGTIKGNWEAVTASREANNWLMYYQPVYEVKFVGAGGRSLLPINLPPDFQGVTPTQPDTVELAWLKNEGSNVDIASYHIYRKAKGEKNFSVVQLSIDALTPTGTTYTYHDKAVSPSGEYVYYLTAYTDDKNAKKPESEPSRQIEVVMPDDTRIHTEMVDNNGVVVKVDRYIKGQWFSQIGLYKKGDVIGRDRLVTMYILENIETFKKEKVVIPGQKPLVITIYRITYRSGQTGKAIIHERESK